MATVTAWPAVANAQGVCWPGVNVPPVEIPAISIPAREIPAREITIPAIPGWVAPTIPTITIPAITIPAVSIPAFTVPGYTVPERCFDSEKTDALPPSKTSVRVRSYHRIDSSFSLALSVAYWRQTVRAAWYLSTAPRALASRPRPVSPRASTCAPTSAPTARSYPVTGAKPRARAAPPASSSAARSRHAAELFQSANVARFRRLDSGERRGQQLRRRPTA